MVNHLLRWPWLAAHLPLFSTNLHQTGLHAPLRTTLACPCVRPSAGLLTAAGLSLPPPPPAMLPPPPPPSQARRLGSAW
jgi:hypothetical protein